MMPLESSFDKQQEEPLYINILNENDKKKYNELREQFSSPKYKNRRNKSNNVFKNMIHLIKLFIEIDQNDVWKRSLVCGIVWINDMIIINTHQLRLLLNKCKSSINGSFQLIGYEALPSGEEYNNHIISLYPFMKNNYSELRQWTARKLVNKEKKNKKNNNLINNQESFINSFQCQNSISCTVKQTKNDIDINQIAQCNEISPAPDLSDIINDYSSNHLLFFSKENEIMDQCENLHYFQNDIENNSFNDDLLPFIPKFPSHINNEMDEIKEYQNHFALNDFNENLYM